jgi:hypothetical protein
VHFVSDVPARLRTGFIREARETLEEAMRLCERAERLRDDMSRLNVGLAVAADGQTLELLDPRGSDGGLTRAIDRFCDTALELGQATWCWAQTINVDAISDLAAYERMTVPIDEESSGVTA